jgi:hypothetical protein
MRQVGHVDPKVTLSIYAQVMYGGEGERERLKVLVERTASVRGESNNEPQTRATGGQLSLGL